MKFEFVKFYVKPNPPEEKGLDEHFAVTKSEHAFKIGVRTIELLEGPTKAGEKFEVPEDWKPLTFEEWRALNFPVSIELSWGYEKPPEKEVEPPARELTEAEKALDAKYRNDLRWWRKGKVERIVKALEDPEIGAPYVHSETTVVSEEYRSPLLNMLLAAAIDHDDPPEDPIEWRRTVSKSNKLDMMKTIIDLLNQALPQMMAMAAAKKARAGKAGQDAAPPAGEVPQT